jgi:hypothetical protein
MSIAANVEARIQTVSVTEDTITSSVCMVLATFRGNTGAACKIRDHWQRFGDTLA